MPPKPPVLAKPARSANRLAPSAGAKLALGACLTLALGAGAAVWTLCQETQRAYQASGRAQALGDSVADSALFKGCEALSRLERPAGYKTSALSKLTVDQARWAAQCVYRGLSSMKPLSSNPAELRSEVARLGADFQTSLLAREDFLRQQTPLMLSADRANALARLRSAAETGDSGARGVSGHIALLGLVSAWEIAALERGSLSEALAAQAMGAQVAQSGARALRKANESQAAFEAPLAFTRWISARLGRQDPSALSRIALDASANALWLAHWRAQRPAERYIAVSLAPARSPSSKPRPRPGPQTPRDPGRDYAQAKARGPAPFELLAEDSALSESPADLQALINTLHP